jgi:hypothetical protein
MASFKKLSTSDVFVVPYAANKNWDLNFTCVPQDGAYFTIFKGKNLTGSIDLTNGPITETQYESLVYRQINHLYYQYHSSSILNSHSLLDSMYYESYMTESSTISTGSYFDFNENPEFINNFPTSSNDIIRVMSFNQNIYGEQIKPNNFVLTASGSYQLVDDGLGNIYDISFSGYYVQPGYYAPPGYIVELDNKVHVGNIFYSQGVVVITNQNYKCLLPTPPNAINDYFSILNVQRTKKLDVLANDYIDSCNSTAIVTSSITTYAYPGYNFPDVTLITGSLFIDECETLGVTPGNYKLYYTTNDNTCLTSNTASINLELYKLPLVMSQSNQGIVCVGGVSPVTFSINYGIPPYQYSVGGGSYNNLPNCEWYQPTASTTAPIGNNTLYIKDSEGTIVSSSFTVLADTFTVTTNRTNVSCYGSGDGKIAVTGSSVYGAPYSASINGGSTWQGFAPNTLFSSLTPATYTVTVKDNLCSTSSLVTITQPSLLTVTVNSTVADCIEPNQDTGIINITVAGGTPPYTYSWVTGSTQVRTTEDPIGLPAGTYKVTVTDANSCTATGSAVISNTNLISIVLTPTNESCGLGNGQISASVTGGSGGFGYYWNTGATGSVITGLISGTYTLNVVDTSTSCVMSGSATITSSPGIAALSKEVIYNECDSSVRLTVTGGTSPYTYLVTSGSISLSSGPTATNPNTINLSGAGLSGGTWQVTVADTNGCQLVSSFVVRAREYRYSDPVCQNLNATLIVDESMGAGTNLIINEATGNRTTMFNTGYQYIQLHSGSTYAAQSPLYPPADPGWVGNYPYSSNTMSVWINGTSVYASSSVDTGSANWLEYGFIGTNSDYLIKVNAISSSAPPTTTTTTSTTTTTTTAASVPCFNYGVYADDGTSNRDSYDFSYINCAGTAVTRSIVNLVDEITICAQEDTVASDSEYIFADKGTSCDTTTTTTTSTTTTTTTAASVPCFSYFVYADDGTSNRDSYTYTYINCAGTAVTSSRVNQGSGITVCAQEDTVDSESGFIFADLGASCGGTTTTTTAAPSTTTTTTAAPETTTTTTAAPGTTTTTTAGPILCFNYGVSADDGTSDRESYTYTYINCAGMAVTRSIVNLGEITVCAQEDTVTSDSGFVTIDLGLSCDTTTTTTTAAPATTTTTTTEAPATTTTTTAAPETTTTTTTEAPATTTTTTAAPETTTTTTTAAPTCFEATVTSTDPTYGAFISATLCDDSSYSDNNMFGTVTLCVKSISVSGGDYTNGGECTVSTTTTTTTEAPATTTTTTTEAPATTTTTTTEAPATTTTTTTEAPATTTTTTTEAPATTTTTTTEAPATTTTTTTEAPTTTTTTTEAPSEYTIDWGFQQSATSGDFSISVNGITVVSVTSNNSGQITVPANATITANVGAGAQSALIAQADLIINNDGTQIYNHSTQGDPFAAETYTYTATGNGTIDATAYEF